MPDRAPHLIRSDIDRAREDLSQTLDEVINHRLKLREQMERHPIAFIAAGAGVAALLGIWIGAKIGHYRAHPTPRFLLRV